MKIIRQSLNRLGKWEYTGLCLLVIVISAMHLGIIMQPDEPVFDEQFYIPDARYIMQGQGTDRIEHPPLGKLFITLGMFLFGDNPFGWRFFSVFFGAICIILFYLICRQLNLPQRASFLATFLLSLENMSFVQAGVAMLDVYSLAFMLASFWFYLKERYLRSGISIGLSILAKLSGALALLAVVLHWLLAGRKHPRRFLVSMLSAPASFLLLMPLLDLLVWRKPVNLIHEIELMLRVTRLSTFAEHPSPMLSRPWDWILKPEILAYWTGPNYLAMISPTIWALIIPTACYLIFKAIKGNNAAAFGFSWFASTYLIWIPISLIFDRQSYVYYFYPVIGSICIGLTLGLSQLSSIGSAAQAGKLITLATPGYVLLHLVAFVILAPVSFWWKVPSCIILYALARRCQQESENDERNIPQEENSDHP